MLIDVFGIVNCTLLQDKEIPRLYVYLLFSKDMIFNFLLYAPVSLVHYS